MRHPDPYRDCCGLYGTVETVETLRDCGDIMRLLETWHGVQSGSCRKAEFEWVGMVGVGLGRRTNIVQTVGVGRECYDEACCEDLPFLRPCAGSFGGS